MNILEELKYYCEEPKPVGALMITGEWGCGKTYLLNQIRNIVTQPFSSILLNFSGNEEKDFLLCYKLFIFCQFGNIWELKIEDLQYLNLD